MLLVIMDLLYGIAFSYHLGLDKNYNQAHPFIKAEFENNAVSAIYYNSEDRVSFCAGYQFKLSDDSNIEAALVTGYTSHDVLPMIKFNHKNFFVVPAYEDYNGKRFGLSVGMEFTL